MEPLICKTLWMPGTDGIACTTVKFWQEETFTWFSDPFNIFTYVPVYLLFSCLFFLFRSCSLFLAIFRLFLLLQMSVRAKVSGQLQRSKIAGFRNAKQPNRSHDFSERRSSYIINSNNHQLRFFFLVTTQISMNVNPTCVTPTPTAPTHQVHMSATVLPVIREMILITKVNYQLLLISLI